MDNLTQPTADSAWTLVSKGYDPLREAIIESRFAISNGFLGLRGGRTITRGTRWVVPPRTYVAGLFDTPGTDGAVPELMPAANWLAVRVLIAGQPLVYHPGDVSLYHMSLDMRRGVLFSEGHHARAGGHDVHVRNQRLVSLGDRSLGLQVIGFDIRSGDGDVTLEAWFEGTELGLVPEHVTEDLGLWRTQHSGKRLAMAASASLQIDGRVCPPVSRGPLTWSWTWTLRPGQAVSFQRMVSVVRSDSATIDPGPEARKRLSQAHHLGWHGVRAAHDAAWAERWQSSDVEIAGDAAAQQALRFAIYHLNSAANPHDERVSIGARALTGEEYRGHVFWDTEIYLLPFYTLTWPEAARAMLMYRYHTLDAARGKAVRMGWRGALYAWESADTGEETTPDYVVTVDNQVVEVLCGKQEQHISADVAYAVWQYWQATGDDAFLRDAGAEIILETARFWASRAQPDADGRHHIRGVIGPDEYHEHIDDNAYTNVMARWNIRRALDCAALLAERWPEAWAALCGRLGFNETELRQWRAVADTLVDGFDPATGLYEQFAGYFGLEDIDLTAYAGRSVPMDMVLGRARTQQSQVVKQADVVALLALLPDAFPGDTAVRNFRHYEPRCSHGSSLSPALHGMVAARLGETGKALAFFRQASQIDLGDVHVATDRGIHIAAQGGLWMLVVMGFAGVSWDADALSVDPRVPDGWSGFSFTVQWRGRSVALRFDAAEQVLEATLVSGETMTLAAAGAAHELRADAALRIPAGRG
ncbi:glycoside hydrolase family 65 protein [Rhodopila globiformis]|uniref:Family 65 glycosyl hydrolase n=1 Tax=Rhodopila globiformis TaxID=1071 RepID=A0A2S6NP53_RHOGL|nr:glycosyl hydrolase family 65 protein [Rhodopila globiformis]PPQ39803.1 family 65 glycosyl hydrolase [Rhodopila globiformis]